MYLVVGSTGNVGRAAALDLAAQGQAVRALVRGGAGRPEAGALAEAGIGIVDGDLTRPETLAEACKGAEVVLCTVTTLPHGRDDGLRRVDLEGTLALIDAAERAGARRFAYVSYSGNIRVPSPLETAKRACEERLRRSPMRAVILRPSFFTEVWLGPAVGFDPSQRKARVFGSGEQRVSYISARNVIEFAIAAAQDEGEGDLVLEMGGPEPISQLDAVRMFEDVFGGPFSVERVPMEALESQHASDDPVQQTFAALSIGLARGDAISGARETAARYGIRLVSAREHVESLRAAG